MSESKKKTSKKIILPPRHKTPTYKRSDVILLPELQSVLDDAASIVSAELAKLRHRSEVGSIPMDLDTARVFQGYVKSAIDLSKEARERDKGFEEEEISDKELLDAFLDNMSKEEMVRLLQDKINDKNQPAQNPSEEDSDE